MKNDSREIVIRPLEPDLLDDYLHFFDHVAFTDHQEWSACYCTFYHLGSQDETRIEAECASRPVRDLLREIAGGLIIRGELQGYLAYNEGQVCGWCNANAKNAYQKLCENRDIWCDGEDLAVKSITCFIVAPGYRRRGIALALLDRVIADAAAEGFAALEAYPAIGELDCFGHYHGYPAMFIKRGFTEHIVLTGYSVYRKML